MNILFLCHRIPYPPNKGDKIRSFNEIKYLSKNHKIFLVFLVDDKKDLIYVDELRKYCETIDYDVISPKWQKIKSLMYLFSRRPLTVPFFYSKRLQKAIDYRASSIKFDAVFAYSSPMAEYIFKSKVIQLSSCPVNQFEDNDKPTGKQVNGLTDKRVNRQTKFIMDFVDVDSDKWRMYSEYSSFPKSLIYKTEQKRLMTYEKKVGETFDTSVFVSDAEVKLFKSFAPDVKAVSVPNGVDLEYFRDVRNVRNVQDVRTNEVIEQAKRLGKSVAQLISYPVNPLKNKQANRFTGKQVNILFTGAMDYFPNDDAVLYFYKSIWPLVKKELPQSRFYIVGNNPSNKIKTISKRDKNIIVTGYVKDIRDYLSMANVFVAPLRVARGIQNKVLEAMAAGLPVVATPQAVQGLNGYNGCMRVEKDDEKFALSILDVINNPDKRQKAIDNSKKFILQNHDWGVNLKKLEELLNTDVYQIKS